MQNMIRVQDSLGTIHVFFDIKDGEVCNISAKDNGSPIEFDIDTMRNYLAREYAASAIEMAMTYRSGQVPLKV